MTDTGLTLHGTFTSGHTHGVELLLRALGLPYRFEQAPATVRGSSEFRQLNPLGQVPVLQDGPLILADSNAILVYLARRYGASTPWLPDDPPTLAAMQSWLSIAAGEIMYGPAIARMVTPWNMEGDVHRARHCRPSPGVHGCSSRGPAVARGGSSVHRRSRLLRLCRARTARTCVP